MALKTPSGLDLEDIEVELLLLALRQRYGYDFHGYARASLIRRLRHLVEFFAVNHLADLVPTLLRDERVAQAIINYISVPVSEFFRDPPVWKAVRNLVLPQLESFPRINIWQIGCGHGQETWTVAILLHECGLAHKVRMVTTDINGELLATARRGAWPADQFDDWRANYLAAGGSGCFEDYFDRRGSEIVIRAERLRPVEFVEHNLVTDDVFLETQFVICRNVLIYFGEALQARALDVFERSLERGGYLLLGSAESVTDGSPTWQALSAEMRIFRKTIHGKERTARPAGIPALPITKT